MLGRALDENNDIFLRRGSISTVKDGAELVQHVRSRLLFYLGECSWATDKGVPYFQRVFVKPMNLPETESIFKAEILNTQGVQRLTDFQMTYNSANRRLAVVFEADSVYGVITGATLNTNAGVGI